MLWGLLGQCWQSGSCVCINSVLDDGQIIVGQGGLFIYLGCVVSDKCVGDGDLGEIYMAVSASSMDFYYFFFLLLFLKRGDGVSISV